MSDEANRILLGLGLTMVSVLIGVMLFSVIQYSSNIGFYNMFQVPQPEQYGSSVAFSSIMLFASSFILSIALLALLTQGAMIKAAKKLVAGYVALATALFFSLGVGGVMMGLLISLVSLVVLYQFALKDVIHRAPVTGLEEDVGSEGTVVDEVDEGDSGRVKVGDVIWWATSSDGSIIDKGEKVRIERASGDKMILTVKKIPSRRTGASGQRKCPYCGASNPRDGTYCSNCGSSLK
jgi:membrane protein implicated in regulation of membrane protease activity